MSTLQSFAGQIDFSHADFQWACPESESLSLPHITGARHASFSALMQLSKMHQPRSGWRWAM